MSHRTFGLTLFALVSGAVCVHANEPATHIDISADSLSIGVDQDPAAANAIARPVAAASCEELQGLALPNVTISTAQAVRAGEATAIPEVIAQAKSTPMFAFMPNLAKAPVFCRIVGYIQPTPDSDIRFEVWMPQSGWNGKFQGLAEGGLAGIIDYANLTTSLNRGYAAASTDTGHKGMMATEWGFNHPEKIKDYHYRGMHLTAVASKSIIRAFYGTLPRRSYLSGCSNGGRQGLIEAQRFAEDYDGILAGAPARVVPDIARVLWMSQKWRNSDTALSPQKLMVLHDAAIKTCDKRDGIADGIISDPLSCHFDPSVLLCKGAQTDYCLTQPQLETARDVYAGLTDSDGKSLHNGQSPGTELSWVSTFEAVFTIAESWYQDLVYNDRTWTADKFNLKRDLESLIRITGSDAGDGDPDLSAFRARGGKLIIYHGLSDASSPPAGAVGYYRSVQDKMSPRAAASVVSLFLIPGMAHCGGGDGPNDFNRGDGVDASSNPNADMSAALENWVEKGVEPQKIIASQYNPAAEFYGRAPNAALVRTRLICAYPKVARWIRKGSADDAANFVCE